MSCERNANKTSSASFSAGLARLAAKSAYVRTVRHNIEVAYRALATIRRFLAGTPAPEPTVVPELKAVETIAPVTPPPGKTCAKCGTSTDQPGTWYRLGGQYHCADCAPSAAKRLGVALAVAVPRKTTGRATPTGTQAGAARIVGQPDTGVAAAPTPSTTDGKPVTLTRNITAQKDTLPKSVELDDGGSTQVGVDGYRLLTATGRETGLALTPLLTVENGRVQVAQDTWRVTHILSGRDVTPMDFPTPEAAFGLGQLMGQFNWHRPFSDFSRRELATIRATLNAYQNAVTQVTQPDPSASAVSKLKRGIPLDAPLHNKLVVDSSGEVVRVFDDLGETLVVTDVLGQSYNVPRIEVRLPDEEDFANTDLAYPLSAEELARETACRNCNRPVGQDRSRQWYRMKGRLLCEHCARVFGPSMNLFLPDTVL